MPAASRSAEPPAPFAAEDGGASLHVRLTPKGGRDAFEGFETLSDGRVVAKARVRAAPEGGKANAALIALLATLLRTPKSRISIVSGETSRIKKVFVSGDSHSLVAALAALAQTSG